MVKQFKYYFLACMAIVMLSLTVASCGDPDDNKEEETYYGVGSYKYELVLSGDLNKITPSVGFQGINTNNESCTIYDQNGKEYSGYYSVNGEETSFSSITASTASNCRVFVSSLVLQNGADGYGTVSVQYKGYFNNKLVKTGEKTISFTPNDLSAVITFDVLNGLQQSR